MTVIGSPRKRAAEMRQTAMNVIAVTSAPVLLRLSLGRWPCNSERDAFRRGFIDRSVRLPALVRALSSVSDVCNLMGYAMRAERGTAEAPLSPLQGDILTVWTGPKLGFLHLEKCGGVAVMRWLAPQFHPEQIDPDPLRAVPPQNFYRAPAGIGRDVARYALLWGHFGLPALERIDPDRFKFTFLREPRARLVSIYHFWRSVRPDVIGDVANDPLMGAAHRHDLLGFLRDPEPSLRDYLDNFYARRLTGRYRTGAAIDPLMADPAASLAAARDALARLDFVGITETMDDSVHRLATLIGAKPPDRPVRGNVTAENHVESADFFRKAERTPMTPEIQTELDRLTTLDRTLYADALAQHRTPHARAAE
ncbi:MULTISPECIES: sulfotransferase family 2 domain-containing protein [Acidiphilium]|uniref:Sulfotransferase family protein n=1 Tax=Acidiphilium rubrum TaxID=526 RepID=A0A8G2CKE6_ACIRU|nr:MULTISPECIES: sulfotransferase family 2 domain-containing protein [Acidiphilium]SIQ76095.1 Sulfotransferase family protein [Acidiphilium rubrum]